MRKWVPVLILLSLYTTLALAGVSGKITGQITSKEDGKPLIGVNIFLEESYLGATTDETGYYVILNVPVGNHSMVVSYIGYQKITVKNVMVSIDLTTTINAALERQVLESSESVIVIADKPLLKADEFSSKHIVNAEEMAAQPVDNIISIAQNQAGVVGNNFRGGRSGEVLVVIDGIPVRDPAAAYTGDLGGFSLNVPKGSVEEMEVSLGGFSAEYGNVQSGVLNLAMKEGSQQLQVTLDATTTNFGQLNETLMEKDAWWYDAKYQQKLENNYRFSVSGPVSLLSKGTFTVSGEIFDKQQGYFLNQDEFSQSYQAKYTQKLSDKSKLAIGGNYSLRDWNYFYFQSAKYGYGDNYLTDLYEFIGDVDASNDTLKRYIYVDDPFTDEYKALQGSVDSLDQTRYIFQNDTDSVAVNYYQNYYLDSPIHHITSRTKESKMIYGIFTYSFSPQTYMELRAQALFSQYLNGKKDYSDKDGDGNTDEYLEWDASVEGPRPEGLEQENSFWWLRGDDEEYRNQQVNTYLMKGDITSQLNKNHMIKSGFQFNWNYTDIMDITWSNVDMTNGYVLNTLRKDIWNEDNIDFGLYIQDKMEFQNDFIAMLGLRYDYFNPNGFGDALLYPGNMDNPIADYNNATGYAIFTDPKEAKASSQLSPRIGISHPISDRDVLFFTYGHYFQRPDNRYLYRNYQYQSLTKVGNWVGNPALEPEKTVAYDVSFEHLFTKHFKMSVTGYFKDVTNLVNSQNFIFPDGTEVHQYVNSDYANVKGVELSFHKVRRSFWSLQGNVTYSIAKGRNSLSSEIKQYPYDKKMYYLDFDRKISLHMNTTLYSNNGIPALRMLTKNWTLNAQYEYGTGKPFTTFGVQGATNDRRLPDYDNMDIRLNRSFQLNNVKMSLYLDVYNVLNNDVYYSIYTEHFDETGIPNIIYQEALTDLTVLTPTIYPSERQFKIGLSLNY